MQMQTQTAEPITGKTLEAQRGTPIERVRDVTFPEFLERYLLPRKPVVIENTTANWPALKKWTPDFWIKTYGDRKVEIDGKTYPLKEIIQMALEPKPGQIPPYYRNIRIGHEYPELQADIAPYPDICKPNWFHSGVFKPLKAGFMAYGEYELFIGGAGRSFPFLHFDVPGAHTYFHQIQGRKTLVLFPPSDTPYLYAKTGVDFNVSALPDLDHVPLDKYPLYAKATRIDVDMKAGDSLFMPFGWWHTAKMPSFSITVAIDVANETNWENVSGFIGKKAKGKLGPLAPLFMAYIRGAGAYLSKQERISR